MAEMRDVEVEDVAKDKGLPSVSLGIVSSALQDNGYWSATMCWGLGD